LQLPKAGPKYDQDNENKARSLIAQELDRLETRLSLLQLNGVSPPGGNHGPVASFTTSRNARTVQFTDTSTDSDGTITGWSWNFGDNQTSTLKNPSHTYAADGNFTVRLTVTDDDGATNTATVTVAVNTTPGNNPPVANFTTSRNGRTVTFTDTSTDADGTVVQRSWNFGDGTTSSLTNPTHTYGVSGTYSVTLSATDDDGAIGTVTKSVTVSSVPVSGSKPFGVAGGFSGTSTIYNNVSQFNMIHDSAGPGYIQSVINTAVANNKKLFLNITGGSHDLNLSNNVKVGISGNVSAGQTITVGPIVYTFRASVGATANEVKIGASGAATLLNLIDAINRKTSTAGTAYGSGTSQNSAAQAYKLTTTLMRIVPRNKQYDSNSISQAPAPTVSDTSSALTLTTGRTADMFVWQDRMNGYNTTTLKNAINTAISNGTILGCSMVDEPNHSTWGVDGFTKSMLDEMATYVKSILPTMAVGVVSRPDWRTSEHYQVLDFTCCQYSYRLGTHAQYIAQTNALVAADGIKILFALNLNGGPQISGCPTSSGQTGGDGFEGVNNCMMTPAQVLETIQNLGNVGIGFRIYTRSVGGAALIAQYGALFDNNDYANAFTSGAAFMSNTTAVSWFR
jgi:PKD repeat protein